MGDPSPLPNLEQPVSLKRKRTGEQLNQAVADEELMQRIIAGDESAFTNLYRRFAHGVFSMIYQILQDRKESEDVLQEAFVQMWKKAATYDAARSALFTWAVMISRNRAIDRLRSRQRRLRAMEEVALEESAAPADAGESADLLLGQSDERKKVRTALLEIPAAQREAIELAFFSGMTQAEVSAKLSEPLGTIKARIRRGLLALRDVLEASA